MTTKILTCSCNHKFQDETYGVNKRVHNVGGTDGSKYKCTVCSRVREGKPEKGSRGKK